MPQKHLTLIANFLIFIQLSRSLTNHDFCLKQNNYCSGQFKYDCNSDKCTIDKRSCSYFNSLVFVSNLNRFRANYAEEKKKFNEFKSKIVNCSVPKYEWNNADFCLNHVNCVAISLKLGGRVWFKQRKLIDCQCADRHLHACDKNVCTIDGLSCDHYKIKSKTQNLTKTIKNCKKM